jgi:hypothetical protein
MANFFGSGNMAKLAIFLAVFTVKKITVKTNYPSITYYWTVPLILDHSHLFGNLTNSKIAETKALEPLES